MTRPPPFLTRVTLCVMFLAECGAAQAAPGGLSVQVRHGLGGRWWIGPGPVTLEATLERGHVEGELTWVSEVPRGRARQVMTLRVDAPARQLFRLVDPVGSSPLATDMVELDGVPLRDAVALTSANGLISTRFLVVVLGDAPTYAAAERAEAAPGRSDVQISVANALAREMPESAFGYGPMRLLVLRGREAARLEPAQVAALLDWVHLGGHLVVSPGVPPAPLRDVAWLQPLLPGTAGAPRTAPVEDLQRQLNVRPDAGRPLDAVAVVPLAGATPTAGPDGVPLACHGKLGAGEIELLGFDESQLGELGLRDFLTARLAPLENLNRPLFGHGWELDVLRLPQAAWSGRHDGLLAAGLIAWALVLWFLARVSTTGGAGSPLRRLFFRPAMALAMALLLLARRPAHEPPRVELFAALQVEAQGDTASGDVVLAASGTAGRETVVPLVPGRVRPHAGTDRRGFWRALYAAPREYRVRAAPAPALEGPRSRDTVPHLFDLAVVVPLGGSWSARLVARDRQVLDGWITNGTRYPLEAGYLMVEGFACLLEPIAAGQTRRGPFKVDHLLTLRVPPGAGEQVDALPELLRHVLRAYSFPSDGLASVPQFNAAVLGRVSVPPATYSPRGTSATTFATFRLPIQSRGARP